MDRPLTGTVALVTGGGTGLGRAISLALAHAGADIAINFARSEADARATLGDVEAAGGRGMVVGADVADWAAVASMVDRVARTLGPVGVLVNNAGVTRFVPERAIEQVTEADWDAMMRINVAGAFACAQAVAPGMQARGHGRILNIASNSAFTAEGSSIPYAVSKAAVVTLTRALARALAPAVQVNALAPGYMETRWLERHLPPERRAAVLGGPTPAAPVAEVAAMAVAILSSSAMTGETVVIDGGESLGIGAAGGSAAGRGATCS